MEGTILLAVALQNWERYNVHALAAREVAAAMAKGSGKTLQVLSVYQYESPTYGGGLSMEMAARHRDDMMRRIDRLIEQRLDDYLQPLKQSGIAVTGLLRVGNPRQVIVQTALRILADVLIIGSHSRRGIFDIALGGTAQQVSSQAPCPVMIVVPKPTA
jgi:nucleotide-binding universal stress UspA family protein